MAIKKFQRQFLEFALEINAIRFGEFTLKSGRISPYFFNAGLFDSGARLAKLGKFYAQAAVESGIEFDMVYGPAYKGIPLAAAFAIALAEHFDRDIPYAFNRKEAKTHAEGGIIVGAPLTGKVLIIDDVISAGLSVKEAVEIIKDQGANPVGVLIALDRQERGAGKISAVNEVENSCNLKVHNIINLQSLKEFLATANKLDEAVAHVKAIEQYHEKYGV
jgi:orotate phosphoribosyltransferase